MKLYRAAVHPSNMQAFMDARAAHKKPTPPWRFQVTDESDNVVYDFISSWDIALGIAKRETWDQFKVSQ